MAKAKVYFTDMRTHPGSNLLDKMERMLESAGLPELEYKGKLVALKLHFGEPGNLAFLRPNYVARVASVIKAAGGLPFLTDANTLYSGRRSDAVNHLRSACENGFNPLSTGCDVVIADGLRGNDYREIEIGMKNVKSAFIGSAIAEADIVVSLTHFKGHELTGFGGALKNLGMGSGSVAGKREMHADSKPVVKTGNCVGCGACERDCAHGAIAVGADKKAAIDYAKCVGCGQCIVACQYGAAAAGSNSASCQEKIVEYAYAVLKGKPHFHVSFVMDVSPNCDCWGHNDAPIVPNIGILASRDPVALDRACYDLVNAAPILPASAAADAGGAADDHFQLMHRGMDGKLGLAYAESIGLGTQDYELVKL
jgi:uncharacterized Fe-S center protein